MAQIETPQEQRDRRYNETVAAIKALNKLPRTEAVKQEIEEHSMVLRAIVEAEERDKKVA